MIVNVTITVIALPVEGVSTTVAVYVPACTPCTFTLKTIVEDDCGGSWPLLGLNLNHGCEGVPAFHFKLWPPVLVTVIDCAAGLTPTVVV